LFRDDMEAFDSAATTGSVIILIAPPGATPVTLENFNYLGKRFGFRCTDTVVEGEIIPEKVGQGPLDGNVWHCAKGIRRFELEDGTWQAHYRTAAGKHPVIVTRRWGKGLIVLSGTDELDRRSGQTQHNALTFVLWARGFRDSAGSPTPSPGSPGTSEASAFAESGTQATTLSPREVDHIIENPPSDLLADRLAAMRGLYSASDRKEPLTRGRLLIPEARRTYFPRFQKSDDLNKELVSIDQFRGAPVLFVYWASWSPESRELIEQLLPLVEPYRTNGVKLVGVSLDRTVEAMKRYQDQSGFTDRQIFEGNGFHSEAARMLEVSRLPRVVLVDRSGRIAATDLPGIAIPIALDELLAE
jgi:thiol-disulfide isomerase/thioredoxin